MLKLYYYITIKSTDSRTIYYTYSHIMTVVLFITLTVISRVIRASEIPSIRLILKRWNTLKFAF